jgi:hypothetical protein
MLSLKRMNYFNNSKITQKRRQHFLWRAKIFACTFYSIDSTFQTVLHRPMRSRFWESVVVLFGFEDIREQCPRLCAKSRTGEAMTGLKTMLLGGWIVLIIWGCRDDAKTTETDSSLGEAFEEETGLLRFDPPSRTFEGTIEVEILSDIQEGEIRYTTDGTIPTPDATRYEGTPVAISSTTELLADLFIDGKGSDTASFAFYIQRSGRIEGDLPIVAIDNFGAGEPGRENERAMFMAFDTTAGSADISRAPDVASRIGFHLRGQSTASFEKRPYRIELQKSDGSDRDYPVLGMPAESDWALRGAFADKALIRDAFFYGLGADIGIAAPKFAFCELFKNLDGGPLSADDYEGVYLIVETIKNATNRLDLKQLRETDTSLPDITGGYIFKFEWRAAEPPLLECPGVSDCWSDLEVADPNPLMPEQENWLVNHLYAFNQALHSASFTDPVDGYAPYIDITSFADQIIVNELGRELDSYIRSAYFYKDRDGVIFAGPIWDYNLVFGVGSSTNYANTETTGFAYEVNITRPTPSNDWFNRLMEDPSFQEALRNRWHELRSGVLSDTALAARIDALVAPIANAAARNFMRWPNLTSPKIVMFDTPTEPTWEGQVQFVREWLAARVVWLDAEWL